MGVPPLQTPLRTLSFLCSAAVPTMAGARLSAGTPVGRSAEAVATPPAPANVALKASAVADPLNNIRIPMPKTPGLRPSVVLRFLALPPRSRREPCLVLCGTDPPPCLGTGPSTRARQIVPVRYLTVNPGAEQQAGDLPERRGGPRARLPQRPLVAVGAEPEH